MTSQLAMLPNPKIVAPPPPYEFGDGGAIRIHHAPRNSEAQSDAPKSPLDAVRDQLSELIRAPLRLEPEAWYEYWANGPHLESFRRLYDAALELAIDGADGAAAIGASYQDECRDDIDHVFGEWAARVEFVEYTLHRCFRIAAELVKTPPPEDKKSDDAGVASRFNYFATWALVGLNSALAIADFTLGGVEAEKVSPSTAAMVLAVADRYVNEAHHAVQDGRRLRDVGDESVTVARTVTDEGYPDIGDDDLGDVEADISNEEDGAA